MNTECSAPTYLESREFLVLASHAISCFILPINLFAVYVIYFHTPPSMKNMRAVMLNAQIWSTISDVEIGIMTIPYMFFPVMAGVPAGLLRFSQVPVRFQMYITSCFISQVASSLMSIIERQQRKICGKQSIVTNRYLIRGLGVFNYIISFVYIAPIFATVPDQHAAKRRLFEKVPCVNPLFFEDAVYVGSENNSLVVTCFSLCIVTFFSQGFIYLLNSCCQLYVHGKRKSVSQTTRKAQSRFFLAVCFQVLLPITFLIIPVSYFTTSIALDYFNQALNNIFFLIIPLHGIANSICTILIYEKYRTFIVRKLFRVPASQSHSHS